MPEQLDPGYRRTLDTVVGTHIDVFDSRPYDLVGRRVSFGGNEEPVDFLLVDLDAHNVQAGYVAETDYEHRSTKSLSRELAAEEFLELFDGSLWDMASPELSDNYNANLDEVFLEGSIYWTEREEEVNDFLMGYTGRGIESHPAIVEVERELF